MNEILLPLSMQAQLWEKRLQANDCCVLCFAESLLLLSLVALAIALISFYIGGGFQRLKIRLYITRRRNKTNSQQLTTIEGITLNR